MNILLIGSGGREHALAWKLAQSPHCDALYCAPGNPGISDVATCVDLKSHKDIIYFCKTEKIEFVVVGPEQPLVEGLGSALRAEGIAVFGPDTAAAQMEGSKGFMKDFCKRHNVPTAAYERFTDVEKAKEYIKQQGVPIVLKTDGLAGGKGVLLPQTMDEALSAVEEMLSGDAFGDAGTEVVIEEFMEGEELSYFALADGENYLALTSAQDHKRVGDGDTGPNTGGMGAYSPAHFMTPELEQKILDKIIAPTVAGMKKDGTPFKGVLFAGLMVKDGEPRLIEYNIRFGDPECQPLMMRLNSDLVELLLATDKGTLNEMQAEWSNKVALNVVMAAKGYPAAYDKGTEIKNIEAVNDIDGAHVFHAGTAMDGDRLISVGGRVLGVVGMSDTIKQAQNIAYQAVDMIDWDGGFCRRDIGYRAIAAQKDQAA